MKKIMYYVFLFFQAVNVLFMMYHAFSKEMDIVRIGAYGFVALVLGACCVWLFNPDYESKSPN